MSKKDYGTECPHLGVVFTPNGGSIPCRDDGQLCPACREDRADRRNRELVNGLALAGLLAQPGVTMPLSHKVKDMAIEYAAALRARGGGSGS